MPYNCPGLSLSGGRGGDGRGILFLLGEGREDREGGVWREGKKEVREGRGVPCPGLGEEREGLGGAPYPGLWYIFPLPPPDQQRNRKYNLQLYYVHGRLMSNQRTQPKRTRELHTLAPEEI